MAGTKKKIQSIIVFFSSDFISGIPPNMAPSTVPHNAIPMTTVPWKVSDEFQIACNFIGLKSPQYQNQKETC
jgi:hypothetical protein